MEMENSSEINVSSGLVIDMVDLERWAEENLTFPSQPAPDETAVTITNSSMDQGGSHQNHPETVSFAKACSKRHCEVLSPSNVYQPAPGPDDNLLWTAVQMEPEFEEQPKPCDGTGLDDMAWQVNENWGLNALGDFGVLSNQGGISGTGVTGADLIPWLPNYKTLSPGLTTDALDPNTAMTSQQDAGWICAAAVPDSTGVLTLTPAILQLSELPKVAKKPRRPYRQDLSQFSPTVASRKERRREQNRKAAERLRIKRKSYYDDLEKKLVEEIETQKKQRNEIERLKGLLAGMQRRLAAHGCTERCLGTTRHQD